MAHAITKPSPGFKWLTNVAMLNQSDESPFLFAYEEALGYTIGSQVWDKDGLSALVVFAQLSAEIYNQGKTLWQQLESIYRQHGLYVNAQRSIALNPDSPPIGDKLRASPPEEIAGLKVLVTEDLKASLKFVTGGRTEALNLPASDVLIYHLEGGARVIVRPSGTEPKLKCYYEVVEAFHESAEYQTVQDKAQASMDQLIKQHQASLS